MKAFLRRLAAKLKRKKAPPAPPKKEGEPKRRKPTHSSFEPLEGRIAPALLLNPMTVQFKDTDGDLVTVKFSKALFTETGSALNVVLDAVFKFKDPTHHVRVSTDSTTPGSADDVNELALIDITALANLGAKNPAAGAGITITATPHNGAGNDLVNIGCIRAATSFVLGTNLGAVVVDGDLGQIDAGDPSKSVGVASLTVQSMGLVGLASQNAGGSLESNITGALGKLVVKGDFVDAVVKVASGTPGKSPGKIGSITIGGSLRVSNGNLANDIAVISAGEAIGTVKIGSGPSDGIFGGGGNNTAQIKSSTKIGNVTISGDLRGGAGKDSGEINAVSGIGSVTLGFNLWAGTGENSGRIVSNGSIGAVKMATLHGDVAIAGGDAGKNAATVSAGGNLKSFTTTDGLKGGKGEGSGSVKVTGTLGKLSIGTGITGGAGKESGRVVAGVLSAGTVSETIVGGAGQSSGTIFATANIGSVTVNNRSFAAAALLAGTGVGSGAIGAKGSIGAVKIAGALDGTTANAGLNAGSVQTDGSIGSLTIGGSLKGGSVEGTGSISADFTIGKLKITGSLVGGAGLISGSVVAGGKITSAAINGGLIGGAGDNSGALIAGLDLSLNGDLTKGSITGTVQGGAGVGSGSVRVGGKLGSLTVGLLGISPGVVLKGNTGGGSGSIFADGGAGTLTINGGFEGGGGANSGAIVASTAVKSVKVTGSIVGSTGDGSGSIQVHDRDLITSIRSGDLGTLTIGGGVTGNAGAGSGGIVVEGTAKTITLGALTGGMGTGSGSITVGGGMAAMVDEYTKIGGATSITIKGALSAGGGVGTAAVNVGAKLGSLNIDGAVTGAAIQVGRDLGKLTIGAAMDDTLVSAQGQVKPTSKTDMAIGAVTVKGSVTDSRFMAGYDRFGNAMNGGAQVGVVNITGNWTASNVVAGVDDVDGDGFGDADDVAIAVVDGPISKIASIIITGNVTGTGGDGDHFGFTARQVMSVKIAGVAQALTSTGTETIDLAGSPATNDTAIREVA
jgi:hypothetical protein